MALRSHKDLQVWQKSMDLLEEIYRLSRPFPREEDWGLTSQLRRAVISVPANIAEGNARGSRRDYAHFVSIARGSLSETETLVLAAIRLKYLREEHAKAALSLLDEVGRMLNTLHNRLTAPSSS
jgi:four helix bundle protein